MRDLLVRLLVFAPMPLIPWRPFIGLLSFSWLAYMRPQDLAYGLHEARYSFYVALLTLVGLALAALMGREKVATFRLQTILMIALCTWVFLSAQTALVPERATATTSQFVKIILICVLTTGLVSTERRFRLQFGLIAFSLGFLGFKYALFGIVRGGTRFDEGPGGFMSDNNSFALALATNIPLLLAVGMTETNRWVRLAAKTLAGFSMLTIIFTFSRGGLLTLMGVLVLLVWRSKQRFSTAAALAVGFALLVTFAPDSLKEQYVERASTISDYEQDGSAMGRIDSWVTALRIARDHPALGVGPGNFEVAYPFYSPTPEDFHVVHNAYLQMLSDSGYPALALLLLVLGVTGWRMQALRSRYGAKSWEGIHAGMIQNSLAAYMSGSMFLNMAHFDLMYHVTALSVCLEVVAAARHEAAERVELGPMGDAGEANPWWRRPPGPESARLEVG